MKIVPARRLRGAITLPGDKAISHRAAIICALARGVSHITNFSASEDCSATLSCLRQLGVRIERRGNALRVEGTTEPGRCHFTAPGGPLYCGNSGSTMRMLAGVLAGQDFTAVLTGDESLSQRPMKRIIEPLETMGARIDSVAGCAPLSISGAYPLRAINYETPVASAQVKSAILLAGLHARGTTQVVESIPTRDHTERMLRWLGAKVIGTNDGPAKTIRIEGAGTSLDARDFAIPGDISSAAFFFVAAALLPGSDLEIDGVGLNPTRTAILPMMKQIGAGITFEVMSEEANEPFGRVRVKTIEGLHPAEDGQAARDGALFSSESAAFSLRGRLTAELIDELPVLSVLGTQIEGGLLARDASELRLKESDRISSMSRNLTQMGASIEELEDGFYVHGKTPLHGATLKSYGDHRVAMACAVAALIAKGESYLEGSECVRVSFPGFFDLLAAVTER